MKLFRRRRGQESLVWLLLTLLAIVASTLLILVPGFRVLAERTWRHVLAEVGQLVTIVWAVIVLVWQLVELALVWLAPGVATGVVLFAVLHWMNSARQLSEWTWFSGAVVSAMLGAALEVIVMIAYCGGSSWNLAKLSISATSGLQTWESIGWTPIVVGGVLALAAYILRHYYVFMPKKTSSA